MSWAELKSVALVGTEKRQVAEAPTTGADGPPPEIAAVQQAALLGVQRLAGLPVTSVASQPEGEPVVLPNEVAAPREASQLIELILGGNVVPPSMSGLLTTRWLRACADGGYVIPHRSMVDVLNEGARSKELRPHIRPVLGHRGRWLAQMDESWQWAVANIDPASQDLPEDSALLSTEELGTFIGGLRTTHAARARELVEQSFPNSNAAGRTALLAALFEGLGDDDEPFLEACLSDGAKNVREVAQQLLDGLPNSRRAQRMISRLEPLVSTEGGGVLRKNLTVSFAEAPSKEDKADMTDKGKGTLASKWLRAIVAGTPLGWWEERLGQGPGKILDRNLRPEPELLAGWTIAAGAQRSTAWADALLELGYVDERSVEAASDEALVAAVAKIVKNHKKLKENVLVFFNRSGPWPLEYGAGLLEWAGSSDTSKVPHAKFEKSLAEHLHPSLAPTVERYITMSPTKQQEKSLRRILQVLTMTTSITNAFATGANP